MTGGERGLAMRRGGRDQHDPIARLQPTIAMDDQGRRQRPAAIGLGLDLGQLLLSHPWIMFEGQCRYAMAPAHIAHQPDKAGDATDRVIAGREPFQLFAGVEILALHPDHSASLR